MKVPGSEIQDEPFLFARNEARLSDIETLSQKDQTKTIIYNGQNEENGLCEPLVSSGSRTQENINQNEPDVSLIHAEELG